MSLPLHVEGRYIKDSNGRTIILRGVNKHSFEDSPFGSWQTPQGGTVFGAFDPAIVAANLDAMKSWGINIIRMYGTASYWINNTGGHRDIVKQIATLAAERGIYLLYLFWHTAPGTSQNVPIWPSPTFPSSTDFINMWASIAQELGPYPNILFSLWNEPEYTHAVDDWFAVVQPCIDAIRATGAENLISVEYAGIDFDLSYGDDCSLSPECYVWQGGKIPTDRIAIPPAPGWETTKVGNTMWWVEGKPLNDPTGNLIYEVHQYGDAFRIWDYETDAGYEYPTSIEYLSYGYTCCLINHVLFTLNKPVIVGEIGPNMWQTGELLERELEFYRNSLTILNQLGVSYLGFWWWPGGSHAHLTSEPNYQPNAAGQILIESISEAPPKPSIPWWLIAIPVGSNLLKGKKKWKGVLE